MRLTPGSRIKEHTDHDLRVENGAARIHVPVVTNDDVEFYLNGSRVVMTAGSAWYLRLSDSAQRLQQGRRRSRAPRHRCRCERLDADPVRIAACRLLSGLVTISAAHITPGVEFARRKNPGARQEKQISSAVPSFPSMTWVTRRSHLPIAG